MFELKTRHDVRVKFKDVALRPAIDYRLFDQLDTDVEFLGLEWFVSKLDSNTNAYKVESHALLTRTLFLMNHYQMSVSFAKKELTFITRDTRQYYVRWQEIDSLSAILYDILRVTERINSIHQYNLYRQETRSITDNLEEDHQSRVTWRKILKLSETYFKV